MTQRSDERRSTGKRKNVAIRNAERQGVVMERNYILIGTDPLGIGFSPMKLSPLQQKIMACPKASKIAQKAGMKYHIEQFHKAIVGEPTELPADMILAVGDFS